MKPLYFFLLWGLTLCISQVHAQCLNPNGSCPTAITLTSGAPCVTGCTFGGAGEAVNSCLFGGSECSWYEFTATATDMFVSIDVTATDGCHISSNVYEATGACLGTEISCLSGAPLDDLHALSGLTVGNTYYVQVCYAPGGPCGRNGFAEYCIEIGEPDPPCDLCNTPCGTASGFATPPTVQDVVDNCQTSPFIPELQPSSINTFCYNFTATASSVDFNVIITSNCGTGNVVGLTWELYEASCGAAIQTGDLSNLTFTPVTIGNDYVFCYTFQVPATCTHSQHCPFFVGAEVLLQNRLIDFNAEKEEEKNTLNWIYSTQNCNFTVERSLNGIEFSPLSEVLFHETTNSSSTTNSYKFSDNHPLRNSYYRLKMINLNSGTVEYSDIKYISRSDINTEAVFDIVSIYPSPVRDVLTIELDAGECNDAIVTLYNSFGQKMSTQQFQLRNGVLNKLSLDTKNLGKGVYSLILEDKNRNIRKSQKIIKY